MDSKYSKSRRYSRSPERRSDSRRGESRSDTSKRKRSRERSPDRNRHRDYGYRHSSSSYSRHYSSRDRSRDRKYSSRDRSKDRRYNSRDRYERSSSRRSPPRSVSRATSSKPKPKDPSKPETLLEKWQKNYCETSEEITKKLMEMANEEENDSKWIRSSPAEIYYKKLNNNQVEATPRLEALCKLFDEELLQRSKRIKATLPPYKPPERKRRMRACRHKSEVCSSSDSSDDEIEDDRTMEELSRKTQHAYRLHPDLWHNEPGEMNDGPLCRCSAKSKRSGIRHGIYKGEEGFPKCAPNSNNAEKLYHYRITITPPTNFLTKTPTIIKYDHHEFIFEGFSLLTHEPLKSDQLPTCKVIRFNIEYTILYIEEKMPENFTIQELDLFCKFSYVY